MKFILQVLMASTIIASPIPTGTALTITEGVKAVSSMKQIAQHASEAFVAGKGVLRNVLGVVKSNPRTAISGAVGVGGLVATGAVIGHTLDHHDDHVKHVDNTNNYSDDEVIYVETNPSHSMGHKPSDLVDDGVWNSKDTQDISSEDLQ